MFPGRRIDRKGAIDYTKVLFNKIKLHSRESAAQIKTRNTHFEWCFTTYPLAWMNMSDKLKCYCLCYYHTLIFNKILLIYIPKLNSNVIFIMVMWNLNIWCTHIFIRLCLRELSDSVFHLHNLIPLDYE